LILIDRIAVVLMAGGWC
jgi:hypothetical protein